MTGHTSFPILRNRMPSEAQERARAKSRTLESEIVATEERRAGRAGISSFGEELIQAMSEALAHAKDEGSAVVHAPVDRLKSKNGSN